MPTDTPTHAAIARELVRLGVKMPEGIDVSRDGVYFENCFAGGTRLSDEASAAMLIGTMVVEARLDRQVDAWASYNQKYGERLHCDRDHSNSPLLSCYAAWKAARGAT